MLRGQRVILRTARGLELGEVIRECHASPQKSKAARPRIVRPTTDQDELLISRLERHKRRAVEACRTALERSGSTAILLDVDQLFDGGTLVMHFLGPVDAIAQSITREVAEEYESIVRSRHFAKLLIDGCGPDCGNKDHGCASCAGCAASCGTGVPG